MVDGAAGMRHQERAHQHLGITRHVREHAREQGVGHTQRLALGDQRAQLRIGDGIERHRRDVRHQPALALPSETGTLP